jgi:hypothetical protein
MIVTGTVVPMLAEAGAMTMLGAAKAFTVKVVVETCVPLVTVTVCGPVAAAAPMTKLPVSVVAFTAVSPVAVIPVPPVTVVAAEKLVLMPVIVNGTVAPWSPVAGAMVTVGAGGTFTVKGAVTTCAPVVTVMV